MDLRIVRLYRQYLQQLDGLSYPPAAVLLEPSIQNEISYRFFDSSNGEHLPPLSYQRRALKDITDRILSAITDPDEDSRSPCLSFISVPPDIPSLQEVSDKLMEHMATKSTAKPMSAYTAAQQRSIVSYHLPSDFASEAPVCIYIEEARNVLAAHGTTGLRVWDASLHLAYFLSTEETSLVRDKAVLELGAGTGLLSILCAGPLQAARVVSTDGDADVVESIESNAELNLRLREPGQKHTLEAKVLDWADGSSLSQVLECEGQEAPIDLVLGADITYAPESMEPLVNILSALHDEYPRVDILISTVIRNEDTFTAFVHTCAKAGFRIKRIPFNCPALDQQRGFYHRTTPPIRIVRLIRDLAALSEEVD